MQTGDIKDYARIAGWSILSVIKFAVVGLAVNWIYGVIKVGWYIKLFETGGWHIALAALMIVLLFAAFPAIYFYLGYLSGMGLAISKAIEKNQGFLTGILGKVAHSKLGLLVTDKGSSIAASSGELRLVRFIVKLSGYKTEWEQLIQVNKQGTVEQKNAAIDNLVEKIVTRLPENISDKFIFSLRNILLINLIIGIGIEILSYYYPAAV